MMLRELHDWMEPSDFDNKTDVYSYYASINHKKLIQQLVAIDYPKHLLTRGAPIHCKTGIQKGGSLSPVLGASILHL
jgi:hypothetical protein